MIICLIEAFTPSYTPPNLPKAHDLIKKEMEASGSKLGKRISSL
jgi:hypothetical protein